MFCNTNSLKSTLCRSSVVLRLIQVEAWRYHPLDDMAAGSGGGADICPGQAVPYALEPSDGSDAVAHD
jgi:hypothetical protein